MVNRSRDIVNNDGINQLTEFSWIPNSKLDERWVNQRRWSDGNEALIETDWGKKKRGNGSICAIFDWMADEKLPSADWYVEKPTVDYVTWSIKHR